MLPKFEFGDEVRIIRNVRNDGTYPGVPTGTLLIRRGSKHSECPTALDGGKLGDLPRGKLFPELDKALFELKAGEVSGVLESELGFHVLRCDAITEAGVLGYNQAKQHIRKLMEQKRKRICQQAWLKGLAQV